MNQDAEPILSPSLSPYGGGGVQSNSIQIPAVLSHRNQVESMSNHKLPYQQEKLQIYNEEKQYNNKELETYIYPTNDSLEFTKGSLDMPPVLRACS